ncbi:hypothetical protein A0256_08940 [Mucilaginibacter sp. PAMC 26640]|nr:hypothetical protein A0256_08940 [Mucilaginibacter sp. PAMC 26640]
MKPIDKLIDLLKQDKVIPVIGAGVSYAAAGIPDWAGAIENGLNFAEDRHVRSEEIDKTRVLLSAGDLVGAADELKKVLNAPGHPYADWLEDLFGNPKTPSLKLLNNIHDLCPSIILTTNYDDLLSAPYKVNKKKIFDWTHHSEIARALNKKEDFILHLHGVYQNPESIILSSTDYKSLAGNKGYKTILQRLWSEHHFLFIGCSRDGILDPDFSTVIDFMNKWFPTVPHEHYILMREPELANGSHIELLKTANVHTITYGKEYDDLPVFLKGINPNQDKMVGRFKKFGEEVDATLHRLSTSGKLDQSAVDQFVKNSLPDKAYWLGSAELKALEEALRNHNLELNNKRQQLASTQALTRGLVSVTKLEELIELWNRHSENIALLLKSDMIDTALLAHSFLKAFPNGMLDDIKHRAWGAIHGQFFDHNFNQFIGEAKHIKTRTIPDAEEIFADRYFFENLKRILQSLKGLLDLDPEVVFPDLAEATITPDSDYQLLFLAKQEISLRKAVYPYEVKAALPGEKTLPFEDAVLMRSGNQHFVVGHTSQHCFSWNPHKDLFPQTFFTAEIGEGIGHVKNLQSSGRVITYIFTDRRLLTFQDMELDVESKINQTFANVLLLPDGESFLGSKSVASNVTGDFIFSIDSNGSISPLLSIVELWKRLSDMEPLKGLIDRLPEGQIPSFTEATIHGTKMKSATWFGEQVIALTATLTIKYFKSSVLIIFRYEEGELKILSRVFFPEKICYSYALIEQADRMDLVAGYVAMGNFSLIQYFEGINTKLDTKAEGQPAILKRIGYKNSDILSVQQIAANRIVAIKESDTLYEVDLPSLTNRSMPVENLIRVTLIVQ